MSWDAGFLLYIQEYIRSDFLNPIMKVLTHSGDKGILLIVLILALLIIPRTRAIGIMSTISIAIEALLNNVLLKNIIARTRPYDEIEGLVNLVGRQSDYSFPSGHTGAAFAVAGAMLVVALFGLPMIEKSGEVSRKDLSLSFKLISVLLIMYATLLAFSRMYVGVHYPTDVLCGLLLGLGTSAMAYLIYQMAIKKIHDRKAIKKEA
ncbi:MAG: phosphatase PAP2 family protein [Clostridiales bacterium]|nr:phosphatase PAP2 family protein [Clostridiales bacterium]